MDGIIVHDVAKEYNKKSILSNINMDIRAGEVTILLGPNGAGKTTLIECMIGLQKFSGKIEICGFNNTDIEAKKKFSYVPEMPYICEFLTVRQHLEFVAKAYSLEDYVDDIQFLLGEFKLLDKQNVLGSKLSKGMKQKVNICCALLTNPKVIILDEPMVGLDVKAIYQLKKAIISLRNFDCAILISTHMLDLVSGFWDKAYILKKGKIKASLYRDDIGNEDNLEDLFLDLTESRDS